MCRAWNLLCASALYAEHRRRYFPLPVSPRPPCKRARGHSSPAGHGLALPCSALEAEVVHRVLAHGARQVGDGSGASGVHCDRLGRTTRRAGGFAHAGSPGRGRRRARPATLNAMCRLSVTGRVGPCQCSSTPVGQPLGSLPGTTRRRRVRAPASTRDFASAATRSPLATTEHSHAALAAGAADRCEARAPQSNESEAKPIGHLIVTLLAFGMPVPGP